MIASTHAEKLGFTGTPCAVLVRQHSNMNSMMKDN
ncbi:hypothetical protein SLEP1_g47111 [Rubroshorea leprosula]|uniref:Uncharacterized protein n=1 Tax=Rubroshorea leprosula TaxID=152421 RepID=A0AAV5LRZ5_9ROSI|nr:hypothetical protein SLEP1_g47111 [Rubroshorea leprosula]